MSSRREFIKLSCGMCMSLAGAGIAAGILQGCTSIPLVAATPDKGKVSLQISAFEKSNLVLLRPKNLGNDVLIVREKKDASEFNYHSLLMQCTHQQQPLNVSGNSIHCPAHGSEFDLEGNVTKEPALRPLKKFITAVDGDTITIDLNS